MSTDGSGKRCPRDSNRPFNLYSPLFQQEAQMDNGQPSHRMLLPNVPSMQQYRQQFLQYQQETQHHVPDQPVQTSPQEKHPTSGHLNQHFAQQLISGQTFPQDQHLVSRQLGRISPNDHYLMSSRLDETSPTAQHTMSSLPNQMSPHSQQLMSSQPNQMSPHSQQFMSSQPNDVSPNAQYLMSSRLHEMSPPAQQLVSNQPNQMSPHSQQLVSNQANQMSPLSQQLVSSLPDQMSPHSQQLVSSLPDQMSPHSQQLVSNLPNQMSPHSQQLMFSQPNQMSLLAQQLMFSQPNQISLQLFRGHANYPQNTPHRQQSAQRVTVNLDSPSFVLDHLCLSDSASALLRPELLATGESLIEQRQYDLSIFSAAGTSSRNQNQNVFPNSFSAPKNFDAFMPEQGPPDLMLDNLLTTKSSCSSRNVTPPVITSASMGNHSFVMNPLSSCHDMPSTSQFYTLPLSSNDASLAGPSMNSMIHTGQFPLKLERQDFNTTAAENSNLPEASLWQNQPSEHFSPDRFTTGREFLESSSSVPNVPLVNSNIGSTSLISPERRAPKRSYDQSFMEPQHRRTSECSTSSGSTSLSVASSGAALSSASSSGAASSGAASLSAASSSAASTGSASVEETVAAPTNSETNNNGEVAEAGDSKDPTYLEKRRKNNESAKKSREARRLKEKTNLSAVLDYHSKIAECSALLHVLQEENRMFRQHMGILGGFDEQCTSGPGMYQFVPQPPTFDKQEHF